jgi:hypothetical protein
MQNVGLREREQSLLASNNRLHTVVVVTTLLQLQPSKMRLSLTKPYGVYRLNENESQRMKMQ